MSQEIAPRPQLRIETRIHSWSRNILRLLMFAFILVGFYSWSFSFSEYKSALIGMTIFMSILAIPLKAGRSMLKPMFWIMLVSSPFMLQGLDTISQASPQLFNAITITGIAGVVVQRLTLPYSYSNLLAPAAHSTAPQLQEYRIQQELYKR